MNYPYGNIAWDGYTTNLLHSTADGSIVGEQSITRPFPNSIVPMALDLQSEPLEGDLIEVHPVIGFSYAVNPTPIIRYTTAPSGGYVFGTNPFQPSTSGYPWNMGYSNFLEKANYNSVVAYIWLLLYEVQHAHFRNGANFVYSAVVQFSAKTPVIQITRLNTSDFKANDQIAVSFMVEGTFKQGNTFSFQLIDEQNNTLTLQTIARTEGAMLTGLMHMFLTIQRARAYIVSSVSRAQSSKYGIIIRPTPLGINVPTFNCLTGTITFNITGGDGSPVTFTASGITSPAPTSIVGIVEAELRAESKPILIQAIQHGQTASYLFDLPAFCTTTNQPTNSLSLLNPAYDCTTGTIRFNTIGGDNSPIQLMAAGITGWTTNPNRFVYKESPMASDVQPFMLLARQNGETLNWV
ncbi:hypothetical protein G8759_14375 [Spirosoma aureum]|uniref:Uncharacterized protein n=1 Tax=Spirosoma aureum TaxID=2692134 RepID=A0A6G9AMN5_9BACT|nr:hypothetical protein [Spirosoma aureum]QIP13717.1 hypothetical protein G8759_14375 [Spirosoma aureum]